MHSRVKTTAVVAVGLGIAAIAVGLWALRHPPGTAAQPVVSGAATSPEPRGDAELRAQLVAHLERSPRDGRGWVLLARHDFDADRYHDAAKAYGQALDIDPKVARDPAIWCEYADALGMMQGGSLAGKPSELIAHALTLDPNQPQALEMAGSAAFERGDPGAAVDYWRRLLAQLPPRSAEYAELAAAIARAEEKAGVKSANKPPARP